MRTMISDLQNHLGRIVTILGWITKSRLLKNVQFLVIRDNTGMAQITNPLDDGANELSAIIEGLPLESAIKVTGLIAPNDRVKLGNLEIIPSAIEVFSTAERPLPIQPTTALDQRLDWRFIDLRRQENLLVFRVQTLIEQAMREYWASQGFIEIHSPKLMGSASEGGSELFRVEYFGGTACLAQSPQFYKQMAMAAGFDNVFEIGPVFRANPSFTARHDTEFTSVDVEISWVDSHDDVMSFEERWLTHTLARVSEVYGTEIEKMFGTKVMVPKVPFPRIPMDEAYAILNRLGHHIPADYNGDLDPEGERRISTYVNEQFGHEFVFVTDYPVRVRPFYHMRYADRPDVTKSFDLLWKGLEITSGAQREHRYDVLVNQAGEKGVELSTIQFYLDFFRYGMPPHGGFGLGLTRMLMIMLGLKNVREVTFLYRGPNRLTP